MEAVSSSFPSNPSATEAHSATTLRTSNSGTCSSAKDPGAASALRIPSAMPFSLAAGTGITPLRAMLRHLLAGDADPNTHARFTLLYGARTPEGLYFRDEFEDLARHRENFRFWPTISGPEKQWSGRRGRVQDHLQEALVNQRQGLDFYLCGPKPWSMTFGRYWPHPGLTSRPFTTKNTGDCTGRTPSRRRKSLTCISHHVARRSG